MHNLRINKPNLRNNKLLVFFDNLEQTVGVV